MGEGASAHVPPRLLSIDVMRGGTMAAMIVVNNPGSWTAMYPPLRHAPWGGWPTPADLVFPFFLFLVGASVPLALRRRLDAGDRRHAILVRVGRRAAFLFAIGFFLNLFPHFDWSTVRVPGVLQRIALVYLGCSVLYLGLRGRGLTVCAIGILLVYTVGLQAIPVPGAGEPKMTPESSWPVWVDERLFGEHSWRGPGDPEGLLSTFPAIVTGLCGVLVSIWLRSRPTGREGAPRIAVAGLLLSVAGGLLSPWVPIAKEVWSASYTLLTTGAAMVVLAGLLRAMEGRDPAAGARHLLTLGRQALLAYVLAHLVSDLSIHVLRWPGGSSLHVLVHRHLLASWLPDALASLAYSLLVLSLVHLLVVIADRRGVRLKV